jgi:catechol 2,3-dioxygenase
VRLRVSDLERSLQFYRDLLGLELLEERTGEVALGFRRATRPSRESGELIVLIEHPGIRRRPRRPQTTGLYHVALLLPSRGELGRTIGGLDLAEYPVRGVSDHGVSESLYLDDPDGNGLEIYADRPRELWPVENGVIQMTIEPLDLEGVMAAARENPAAWTGLPPETVVGHVHFTVSDLKRSVDFYRDVVGFDLMMSVPTLTAVSAGGYHHHLNLNTWAGDGAPADSEEMAGLESWELRISAEADRRALIQRLSQAGALAGSEDQVLARDPDSIAMELRGA